MPPDLRPYEGFGYARPCFAADSDSPLDTTAIISAMLEGHFKPMTQEDEMAFQGIEYSGYIWHAKPADYTGERLDGWDITAILDHGPSGAHVEVYATDSRDGEQHAWTLDIGALGRPEDEAGGWRKNI